MAKTKEHWNKIDPEKRNTKNLDYYMRTVVPARPGDERPRDGPEHDLALSSHFDGRHTVVVIIIIIAREKERKKEGCFKSDGKNKRTSLERKSTQKKEHKKSRLLLRTVVPARPGDERPRDGPEHEASLLSSHFIARQSRRRRKAVSVSSAPKGRHTLTLYL